MDHDGIATLQVIGEVRIGEWRGYLHHLITVECRHVLMKNED